MTEPDVLAEAVSRTFRSQALRTVLLIDDQFPSYSDILSDPDYATKFKESERALRLFRLFNSLDMPCYIENSIRPPTADAHDQIDVEHIRKSDLIVLDWQLTPNSNDNSKSIHIVRRLSETKHFNTIVLYTQETNLQRVWLDLACSLRRGWADAEELLRENAAAADAWEKVVAEGTIQNPPDDAWVAYILGGVRGLSTEQRALLETELTDRGVDRQLCGALIEVLIHRAVRDRLKDDSTAKKGPQHWVSGACAAGRPLWLQCENCFVVIIGKVVKAGQMEETNDPDGIIPNLDGALVDWKPSFLQVVISDIQNLLELEALAMEEAHLRDPAMHAGLSYYLLGLVGETTDPQDTEQLLPTMEMVVERLVEGLRRRISSDRGLMELGAKLLSYELKNLGWSAGTRKKPGEIYVDAAKLARQEKAPEKGAALFRLNSFLSTEVFGLAHLTTGTVIRLEASEDYWVCMSPACDLTVRDPSPFQAWTSALHPMRALVAVKLKLESENNSPLGEAEKGRHIFLLTPQGSKTFCTVDKNSNQPVYEFLFPTKAGRVERSPSSIQPSFKAFRILRDGPDVSEVRNFQVHDFVVIGQLRPAYASRLLQTMGQHLARIGVDFINLPN